MNTKTKSKPPYWLGILCLIPVVGQILGFVMILLGLFKYKDKWFTLLGIVGVALFWVYTGIGSNILKNNESVQESFTFFSQNNLNELVEKIEFYKLSTGDYPVRLENLKANDKFAPIEDPIQNSKQRENILYNYQKLPNGYRLFSSGSDGIPGNADDLYPKIQGLDTSKIGLRIE